MFRGLGVSVTALAATTLLVVPAFAVAGPTGSGGVIFDIDFAPNGDLLAGSAGADATAADPPPGTPATGRLRVRKDVKDLTAREQREFVDAVLALKSAPSPFDPDLNYYDQFVAWHLSLYPCRPGHEMARAHGGPMFLPWHRQYLLLFENALREVSREPITVPYWDWTDPESTAAVFADDLMGGDGDPDEEYAVTTGPFAKGKWELNVHPTGLQWSSSATTYLTRRFGSFPGFADLPTPEDVDFVLERPTYDVPPYDTSSDPNTSFRNALEGFWQSVGQTKVPAGSMVCGPDGTMMVTSGPGVHNLVHMWVGGLLDESPIGGRVGTMALPSSPNDPVFFLHHSNIDRLWAEWQGTHGVGSYEPDSCDRRSVELGCSANTGTDHMHPFGVTPDDVADINALGYRYDTRRSSPIGYRDGTRRSSPIGYRDDTRRSSPICVLTRTPSSLNGERSAIFVGSSLRTGDRPRWSSGRFSAAERAGARPQLAASAPLAP